MESRRRPTGYRYLSPQRLGNHTLGFFFILGSTVTDRAVFFVDGNNFYHAARAAGVSSLGDLDYCKVVAKLRGPRAFAGLRYYIGRVRQEGDERLYAEQRKFITQLEAQSSLISTHFGRLELRERRNEAADELKAYLQAMPVRLETAVYRDLFDIAQRHQTSSVHVEKAVDVMLAVDLVVMAHQDKYDAAYILSADGDYTHAVAEARRMGKKVFAASAANGHQLKLACNTFIPLAREWFDDCYKDPPPPKPGAASTKPKPAGAAAARPTVIVRPAKR